MSFHNHDPKDPTINKYPAPQRPISKEMKESKPVTAALLVKEDGQIFLIQDLPEEPSYLDDAVYWRDYETALASAKESAILVSDQEKAAGVIWDHLKGTSTDYILRNAEKPKPGIYPIPNLKFEVWNRGDGEVKETKFPPGVKPVFHQVAHLIVETKCCEVPADLHGTCCGWQNANIQCSPEGIITDSRHPGFGQKFDQWSKPVTEGKTAEEILDKYITWDAALEECADKIFFIKAMEEYARSKWDEACEAQMDIVRDTMNDEYRYEFTTPEFKP